MNSSFPGRRAAGLFAAALALCATTMLPASAQNLADFEKKVTVKTLSNGWTFILYERSEAPVFSFATHANVGSAQEVTGITGIAHMFEHMAFKGTTTIGTTDYPAEKKALEKVDQAYAAYDSYRRVRGADPEKVKSLQKAWKDAQEEADRYIKKNEFGEIIDREGGVGLNAFTNADSTVYFYALPSNKFELWAYLESERFMRPVFREFYKERDVVKEERRLRTESQPIGRLIEQFGMVAFSAHPYQHPVVGYMSDLDSFSRADAEKFYRTYYVPSNMVTALVGDVKAAEVVPLLEKYFGRIPKGDPPPPLRTVEPPQIAEKSIRIPDPSQPFYVEGYHKPAATSPDEPIYQAIVDVLSNGRTSRLYRSLVRDKQIAVAVQSFPSYPGSKFPNLFILFSVPAPGHTNEESRDAIRAELERLKKEDITPEELAMVKTHAKAALLEGLNSNDGLAESLAEYQTVFGDWRELFKAVDKIDRVSQADIRRIASAVFTDTNRTVAVVETTAAMPMSGGEAGR
ncbi:MAG TPA: pitrilysin family protein [Candidatus Polarisedimenticolia bacterium]|nr:pitrilysin family protein [Candidatus Polarisedimenticolia bacterium]